MRRSLIRNKPRKSILKIFFIHFLLILNLLFSLEQIPSSSLTDWEILQNKNVWIGWKEYNESQWCRAKSTIKAPLEDISSIIEDKANYPKVFKRVESVKIITDEIVHIVLDMPFPFYGRDYIVNYTQLKDDDDIIYRFNAVNDSGIPIHKDYVRLIHAAGEWRLHPLDESSTEITYTWNGELLGDFPDWALTRAWKIQGDEVLNWLKEAAKDQ